VSSSVVLLTMLAVIGGLLWSVVAFSMNNIRCNCVG
jgi:hypothetical protein